MLVGWYTGTQGSLNEPFTRRLGWLRDRMARKMVRRNPLQNKAAWARIIQPSFVGTSTSIFPTIRNLYLNRGKRQALLGKSSRLLWRTVSICPLRLSLKPAGFSLRLLKDVPVHRTLVWW